MNPTLLVRRASMIVVLGGIISAACAPVPTSLGGGKSGKSRDDAIGEASKDVVAPASNDADRLLGTERAQTFDRLRREVESVQVISTVGLARLGLRWDDGSAFADARARFLSAKTTQDVYYALRALQRATHDGHSRLELDSSPILREPTTLVALPLEVVVEYESGAPRYIVSSDGPHRGARVVAVDGKPIANVERELVTWVVGSSPEKWRASVARWLTRRDTAVLPAPQPGAQAKFDLTAPDGTSKQIALEWRATSLAPASSADPCTSAVRPNPDYAARRPEHVGELLCVYPSKDARTKIVRWFSFSYEEDANFRADYDKMLEHVSNAGVTKILFDVRENDGGVWDPSVVAAFTSTPLKQLAVEVIFKPGLKKNPSLLDDAEGGPQAALAKAFLLANPKAETSPRFPFICPSGRCGNDELTVPTPESPMVADVAVLTGPDCFSACDNFVAMMKDSGVARVVGMPSAGADSPVRVRVPITLEDGATKLGLVLTVAVNRRPNGAVLEGAPDMPSVPVFPSASNRGRYLDAVLQALAF